MHSLRRGRKFRPSLLRSGGADGIVVKFDVDRPMKHSNLCLDTGEALSPGPQDLPVWGVKFSDEKWHFFRFESNARSFQVARIANRP